MKKILIVGDGSYVGESVKKYLQKYPDEYEIETLHARGFEPEIEQFECYDCVFYVAGIAHRRETRKNAHLYYEVNRNLAVSVAEKAKEAGVKQFIIMSSMAVYGISEGMIKKGTKPKPGTHYGRSKLEADRAIWKMRNQDFKVAVLRPPMIYGKGCKGNYQRLRWLALHTPVFPKVDNERSMLFIGNLNVYIKDCIDGAKQGLFFPQNSEYVNTSEMVRLVALTNGKKVRLTKVLNPLILLLKLSSLGAIDKVFGNLKYELSGDIDRYGFIDTIALTESRMV